MSKFQPEENHQVLGFYLLNWGQSMIFRRQSMNFRVRSFNKKYQGGGGLILKNIHTLESKFSLLESKLFSSLLFYSPSIALT